MTDWKPVFVLPNVELAEPIEGDPAVLAPAEDDRVVELCDAYPKFRSFLGRFSDAFGVKLTPAVLLVRADAPESFYRVDAIAGFRDAVAIAAVSYNRALNLKYSRGVYLIFGDVFSFYPWMLDKHYGNLIGRTPAFLGLHEVSKFCGQAFPLLPRQRLDWIDEPLLSALLVRWHRHYSVPEQSLTDIALFRSLNMAYHASLMPAASDVRLYDIGRLIALWVSAFEILVHPGGNGQATRDKVFGLIESVKWNQDASAKAVFDTGGKKNIKRTLASWLYEKIYDCRCAFLHGNPVSHDSLLLPNSKHNLFEYSAPLYRMVLTAFFERSALPLTDAEAFGDYNRDSLTFWRYQRDVEEALLTAHQPSSKDRATAADQKPTE